jgi:hypothetical protein
MGKLRVRRSLWLEGLVKRREEIAKRESEGRAWERGARAKLEEAEEACRFYGFVVEPLDPLTISITPEPLYNEMVNVDASTLRVVKPKEALNWTLDPEYAFEVTFAPSVRKMVEPERDPYDDPPRDDEEPKLVPEPPEMLNLDSKQKEPSYYRSVQEKLAGVLTDIVERLIDLKHPELVLKKEED